MPKNRLVYKQRYHCSENNDAYIEGTNDVPSIESHMIKNYVAPLDILKRSRSYIYADCAIYVLESIELMRFGVVL